MLIIEQFGKIIGLVFFVIVLDFEYRFITVSGIEHREPARMRRRRQESRSTHSPSIENGIAISYGCLIIFGPKTHIGTQCVKSPFGSTTFGFPRRIERFFGRTRRQCGSDIRTYLFDQLGFGRLSHFRRVRVIFIRLGNQWGFPPVTHQIEITQCAQEISLGLMRLHRRQGVCSVDFLGIGSSLYHRIGNIDNLVKRPPVAQILVGGLHLEVLQVTAFLVVNTAGTQFPPRNKVRLYHCT